MPSHLPSLQITSLETSLPSTSTDHILSNRKAIKPIPIIRKTLPNSPKLRTKLRANAYKNFSKISAAGPHTLQILQSLQKSSSLKMVPKFEFDPYLCDLSCLAELNLALKKLKTIKQLTLIFRRYNTLPWNQFSVSYNRVHGLEEVKTIKAIGWNISKLSRLWKTKVEFSSTINVREAHILAVYTGIEKCFSLKSLDWLLVDTPGFSVKYNRYFAKVMKKLQKLRYYKDYITSKKETLNADWFSLQNFADFPKIPQIRHLELVYSAAKEWSNVGDNGYDSSEMSVKYLSSHCFLESFKAKLIKSSFWSHDPLTLLKCFTSLPNFRRLDLEFLNCEIGDMDLVAFVYGLSLLPNLEYVCFKVIQNYPISIDYIEKSVDRISNMTNLKKFNLYFRKQFIPKRDVPRIEKMFSRFKDVNCSCCPQSLYLYKNQT